MNKRLRKKRKKQALKRLGELFSKYYRKVEPRIPVISKNAVPTMSKEELDEWGKKLNETIEPFTYTPYLIDPEEDK
jgi:hypothetical protein